MKNIVSPERKSYQDVGFCGRKHSRHKRKDGTYSRCLNLVKPGYKSCEYHLSVDRKEWRRMYAKNPLKEQRRQREIKKRWLEEGRCQTCGAPREGGTDTTCCNCSINLHPIGGSQYGNPRINQKSTG